MAKKRKNKKTWFIKIRASYLPSSGAGWLTYIPFTGFLLGVPYLAINNTDNLIIAALITVPNWIAAAAVMTYIASQKS